MSLGLGNLRFPRWGGIGLQGQCRVVLHLGPKAPNTVAVIMDVCGPKRLKPFRAGMLGLKAQPTHVNKGRRPLFARGPDLLCKSGLGIVSKLRALGPKAPMDVLAMGTCM